jgi:hypothetical protein
MEIIDEIEAAVRKADAYVQEALQNIQLSAWSDMPNPVTAKLLDAHTILRDLLLDGTPMEQ